MPAGQVCSSLAWLPVIGTLLGAIVGFAASFLVAWFNQRKSEEIARGDRRRVRLEELYRTLIEIRKDYQATLSQAFSKVHSNTPMSTTSYTSIPPIINAEMLVNLYFPELITCFKHFEAVKNAFGSQLADAIIVNTSSLSLDKKQKLCGSFLDSFQKIDASITAFQVEISRTIDA
jgi:hypothetical protein